MATMVDVEVSPDTREGPSSSVWGGFNVLEMLRSPRTGTHFFEDFVALNPLTTVQADTGATVADGAERGGSLALTTGATDNNEAYAGGALGGFNISDSDLKDLRFEARIKVSSLVSQTVFVGLIDPAAIAANMILDTGVMGDFDYIGFRIAEADSDGIDFVYQANGQSEVVVVNEAQVAVAGTWYKLGFRYLQNENTARRIAAFVNGTEQSTYVTAANIAAATFPDGVLMTPVVGIKTNSAATKVLDCDWIRVIQQRYDS